MTPEQIRAARALLAWKQGDLAKAAHISVTAVNYFERGIGAARSDTIAAMQGALEQAGIEFLSGNGLRFKRDAFQFLNHQGDDFIARLSEDMYRALYKGDQEIVTCSTDEKLWHKYAASINREYIAFARAKKIRERILIAEETPHTNNPDVVYRTLPENLIGRVTYTVYADRVAYILWPLKRVIVLRNADLADTILAQFNFLWRQAKPHRR